MRLTQPPLQHHHTDLYADNRMPCEHIAVQASRMRSPRVQRPTPLQHLGETPCSTVQKYVIAAKT